MVNRLKQWMECACVCEHSRHPYVRPPPTDMCVYTERIFHIHCWTSSLIVRGWGRLQKCWSFYTHSTTSPPPPARLSGRVRESDVYLCAFNVFLNFHFFSTLTMKNQQNRSFWFASVFQQSSLRLDVLFGRRSRWRWRIRILSPFLLGPDLIFGPISSRN